VADYTIGTNQRPGDGPAIAFAQAFYGALAAGRTVLAAFELGLGQLMFDGGPEDGMPVRRIRPGVDLDATLTPRPGAGDVHARQGPAPPRRDPVRILATQRRPGLSNGQGAPAVPDRRPAEPRNRVSRLTDRDATFGTG
jgi:hypothetical protein